MSGALNFDSVREFGLKLPDVSESTYYGARALKVNGRMLACIPVNDSAEVNCAVISIGVEQRTALIKMNPSAYYVTDHYAPHPTMLVRLSRLSRDDLERTLRLAWEFLCAQNRRLKRRRVAAKQKVTKSSHDRK